MLLTLFSPQEATNVLQLQSEAVSQPINTTLQQQVQTILDTIRLQGDVGLIEIAAQLNDLQPDSADVAQPFKLTSAYRQAKCSSVYPQAKATLTYAAENIRHFAQAVMRSIQSVHLEQPGFSAGLRFHPIENVACYAPGGRYPLPSTALMTAITAREAGCPHVALFCPNPTAEVILAAELSGVDEIYQIGGAQAVAVAAFGTQTIPKFDLFTGPGNAYVTEAKRQLQGKIGIDMLAGPSEVCIIADASADPQRIAVEMLAQAEHDPQARAILLLTDTDLGYQVQQWVETEYLRLHLPAWVQQSLKLSGIYVLPDLEACISWANKIAPEHLVLMTKHPEDDAPKLHHYGAIFLGEACTVAYGDYVAGPNHTLPTAQTARFQGALSPLTFLRPQTWLAVHPNETGQLAEHTARFAELEGLVAHQAAASLRRV
jgi:histidinol dehydrogenase